MRPCRCATDCPCTESTTSIARSPQRTATSSPSRTTATTPWRSNTTRNSTSMVVTFLPSTNRSMCVGTARRRGGRRGRRPPRCPARRACVPRRWSGRSTCAIAETSAVPRSSPRSPSTTVATSRLTARNAVPPRRGQVTECRPGHIALVEPVGEGLGTVDACGVLEQERSREQRPRAVSTTVIGPPPREPACPDRHAARAARRTSATNAPQVIGRSRQRAIDTRSGDCLHMSAHPLGPPPRPHARRPTPRRRAASTPPRQPPPRPRPSTVGDERRGGW